MDNALLVTAEAEIRHQAVPTPERPPEPTAAQMYLPKRVPGSRVTNLCRYDTPCSSFRLAVAAVATGRCTGNIC